METTAEPASTSKVSLWAGRILSTLPVLLLIMSATMKIVKPPGFAEDFGKSGYAIHLATPIGVAEIVSTILYVIPQTAVLGAILLTGYLGGATATHVRAEDGFFFAPVLFGVVIWLGLYLRDARVRALIPFRRNATSGK